MSFLAGAVNIAINGNNEDFKKSVLGAEDSLDSLDRKAGKTSKGFSMLEGATSLLTSALTGGLAIGIAAIPTAFGVATASALNFSSDLNRIQKEFQAELGVTEDIATGLGDVAKNVFKNNFGDNLQDIKTTIVDVRRQFGLLKDEELQSITEGALAIRDSFNADVNTTLNASRALMDNFGLSSEESLNLIAKGFQSGLDSSGDFLETVSEYSVQFGEANATADEFFNILASGQQSGVLGTDKVADAFKELRISIQEDGSTLDEFFQEIGLSATDLNRRLQGGESIAEIYNDIVKGLKGVDDQARRATLAQEIFKSMGEDAGTAFIQSIDTASDLWVANNNALEQLNKRYETLPAFFAGIWRESIVEISPFTDKILELANDSLPYLRAGFDTLKTELSEIGRNEGLLNFANLLMSIAGDQLSSVFTQMQNIVTGVNNVNNSISESVNQNLPFFKQAWEDVDEPVLQFIKAGIAFRDTVFSGVVPAFQAVGFIITDFLIPAFKLGWPIISQFFTGFLNLTTGTLNIITGIFQAFSGVITGILTGDFSLAAEGAKRVFTGLGQFFAGSIQIITAPFAKIIGDIRSQFNINWSDLGWNIITGIINGITGGAWQVNSALVNLAQGALQSFKDTLGIASPSKEFIQASDEIKNGVIHSFDNLDEVEKASQKLANATLNPIKFDTPNLPVTQASQTSQTQAQPNIINLNFSGLMLATDENLREFYQRSARILKEVIPN